VAITPVTHVEAPRIATDQALHSHPEVRLGRHEDEMEMRVEEAIREDRPFEATHDVAESPQQSATIRIVPHDRGPAVPLRDHVMDRSWPLVTLPARHHEQPGDDSPCSQDALADMAQQGVALEPDAGTRSTNKASGWSPTPARAPRTRRRVETRRHGRTIEASG
jgi:hypothetical protein